MTDDTPTGWHPFWAIADAHAAEVDAIAAVVCIVLRRWRDEHGQRLRPAKEIPSDERLRRLSDGFAGAALMARDEQPDKGERLPQQTRRIARRWLKHSPTDDERSSAAGVATMRAANFIIMDAGVTLSEALTEVAARPPGNRGRVENASLAGLADWYALLFEAATGRQPVFSNSEPPAGSFGNFISELAKLGLPSIGWELQQEAVARRRAAATRIP